MHRLIRVVGAFERALPSCQTLIPRPKLVIASCLSLVASMFLTAFAMAQAQPGVTFNTLHPFSSASGGIPAADLLFASDGNLYGATSGYSITETVTTTSGDTTNTYTYTTSNGGTIFKITPSGDFTNIHTFTEESDGISLEGISPRGGLTAGGDGNELYGTTSGIIESVAYTVTNGVSSPGTVTLTTSGRGTVFKLDIPTETLTTIYNFANGTVGSGPTGSLILGSDGPLYGTTSGGAALVTGLVSGNGTLTSGTGVGSVFTITNTGVVNSLGSFSGGTDGGEPIGALTEGRDGNYYGTTFDGGTVTIDGTVLTNQGTIYQLTSFGVLNTIYTFTGESDGSAPTGKLARPGNGYLYGTASEGAGGYGSIFKVTTSGDLQTLHTFTGSIGFGYDSGVPLAGLIVGFDGNLYGTTSGFSGVGIDGSISYDYGSVFRITPDGVFTTLYNFTGRSDGGFPEGGLVQDRQGHFYGTTSTGGNKDGSGIGTVFQLTIADALAFYDGEVELANSVYYLAFPNGNYFGYYSFLTDPNYIFHYDLGYEYVFNANDANNGVYLYDFASDDFFYTSPTFSFPYLYDFNLGTVLYYYPDTSNPGHYTTNPRYFYDFATGAIITK